MKMQYIGNTCFTIKSGAIYELIRIKRTININYFPSGIMLMFKTPEGHYFGWSDRKDWVKMK
jgi:hypothetical protein